MQAFNIAVMSRVKTPHRTLKRMLKALDAPSKPETPAQANLALLSAMRGLVARSNRGA